MSHWDNLSHSSAFRDFDHFGNPPLVVVPNWIRYPGDDGGDLVLPESGAGGDGGLVISTARSFAFVLGCLFMALLVLG